jgi:hypothetical protein
MLKADLPSEAEPSSPPPTPRSITSCQPSHRQKRRRKQMKTGNPVEWPRFRFKSKPDAIRWEEISLNEMPLEQVRSITIKAEVGCFTVVTLEMMGEVELDGEVGQVIINQVEAPAEELKSEPPDPMPRLGP